MPTSTHLVLQRSRGVMARVSAWAGFALLAFCVSSPAQADRIRSSFAASELTTDHFLGEALRVQGDGQPGLEKLKLAVAHYRERKFDDALDAFRQARKANAALSPPELMLARLFFAEGQVPAGRAALERAALDAPNDPEIYIVFGELALFDGQLTTASLHFQHAASLLADGDASAKTNRWRIQVYDGLVSVAERRRQWDAAETQLNAWLKLDPESGIAWQRLGRVLFEQERTDEATTAFAKAEKNDENLDAAAVSMGRLYHQAGDSAKAGEWMAAAVKKSPQNPRVHVAVALWNLEIDRPDEAQRHLDEAAKLDPEFPDLKRLQGLAARFRRDWPTAAAIFQELFAENPADFAASNQLALVLIEQAEPQQRRAAQLAELNARQYPQNAEALATLGWIYYRLGRLDDAEQLLQRAVSGGTVNSDTGYYLSQVLIEREKLDEARELLTAATAALGPFVYRSEAQSWLKVHAVKNSD